MKMTFKINERSFQMQSIWEKLCLSDVCFSKSCENIQKKATLPKQENEGTFFGKGG